MTVEEQMQDLATVTINAMKEAMKIRMVQADVKTAFEEVRDWFIDEMTYTPLQAANMSRLVLHAVGQDYDLEAYTQDELLQIKEIIDNEY